MKTFMVGSILLLAACGGGGGDDVECTTNYGVYSETTRCNFNDQPASTAPANTPPTTQPGGIPGATPGAPLPNEEVTVVRGPNTAAP